MRFQLLLVDTDGVVLTSDGVPALNGISPAAALMFDTMADAFDKKDALLARFPSAEVVVTDDETGNVWSFCGDNGSPQGRPRLNAASLTQHTPIDGHVIRAFTARRRRKAARARSEPPMHWLTPQNRKDGLVVVPRPRPAPCSADDIRRWSDAGINTVVSLLRDDEQRELGLADEGIRCHEVGIAFARIPVDDRGLPDSGIDFVQRCLRLHELRAFGATIAVHCRASIGRATLMAVALLVLDGLSPQEALSHVAHARGRDVPDTDEQRQWLLQLPSLVRSVRQLQTW